MGDMELRMQIGWPMSLKLPPSDPPLTLAEQVQQLREKIERLEATADYYMRQPDLRRGKVGPLGTLTFEPNHHEESEWEARIELAKAKIKLTELEAELDSK